MEEALEKYLDDSWTSQDEETTTDDQVEQSETTELESKEVEETSGESSEKSADDSLESKLDKLELEKPENEGKSDLLNMVNGLGVVRNKLPVEFESEEQVKELLSKGFDYTEKTQEFSEEKKQELEKITQERESLEKERAEFQDYEKKVQNDMLSHKILFNVIKRLEKDDPDAVATIEDMYDRELQLHQSSIDNPVVNELKETIKGLQEKIEGKDTESIEKENESIIKEWETGLAEVQQGWGTKLHGLGVKPNWQKVQDIWKNDNSNSMTVKQAFLAAHGDEISKALESNKKLLETKVKSSTRKNPAVEGNDLVEKSTPSKPESHFDAAKRIAEKLFSI